MCDDFALQFSIERRVAGMIHQVSSWRGQLAGQGRIHIPSARPVDDRPDAEPVQFPMTGVRGQASLCHAGVQRAVIKERCVRIGTNS